MRKLFRQTLKWEMVVGVTLFVVCFLFFSNKVSYAASKSSAKAGNRNAASVNENLPETFKIQAMKFMEEGSVISSVAETGVNYTEMRKLYVQTKGTYGLLNAVWPKDKLKDVKQSFEKALNAWDLTLYLWTLKIDHADAPAEPNVNRYLDFMALSKSCNLDDILEISVYPDDYFITQYKSKKYIPLLEVNIRRLLTVGAQQFENGRTILLQKLQQSISK